MTFDVYDLTADEATPRVNGNKTPINLPSKFFERSIHVFCCIRVLDKLLQKVKYGNRENIA
jgi:hypothetical protein